LKTLTAGLAQVTKSLFFATSRHARPPPLALPLTDVLQRSRPMAERSKYQENIIKNYYKNAGAIGLQRLSELVTDLYLAEGKARAGVWKKIQATLEKLKVPASRIEHVVKADNPTLLAKLLEELLAKDDAGK